MIEHKENIFNKWKNGLARTRKTTFGRISQVLGMAEIDDETWEDLEAMFIQSDMGIETTEEVIEALKNRVETDGFTKADELRDAIQSELHARICAPPELEFTESPSVILIVPGSDAR